MPPPLSLTLTARVRRLLPTIQGGVAAGLGSRAINDAIRAATGTGIRRTDLLRVMREIRGVQEAGDRLKFVRRDRTPDPNRVPTALTPIRRRFGSTIEVRGRLLDTGESITRFVQVTHDQPLDRGALEDIGAGFIEDDVDEYGIALDSVLLVRQVKRA